MYVFQADVTRRPGQQREPESDHRLPPGFFNDSPRHPHPSRTHRHPSPTRQQNHDVDRHLPSHSHALSLLDRIALIFQRNTLNTPPRPRFFEWTQNALFNTPSNDEGIELQEPQPTVVDVPLAQGNFRNYSARELRMKKEKEKNNAKNVSAGSSRPPQSSVTQKSGGEAQAQPSEELHTAVSTSSITPAVAATSATTTRWTRFWTTACCISTQNTDGHH
ncbi:hypothetical protein K503DRAFT_769439 [Rhizopogon vinicolor AM-OR11-026]|uniref:Uncharacterized protein n=1 Tax=Rhizopogon vinicolor AM-OR11-026 TaxID=1314800 RepID=A0A1B7N400_9AGAM|nr:hypothetical protein K503DRAFT_769439 [Rhizopogon vinicolor AM-OR11-026]